MTGRCLLNFKVFLSRILSLKVVEIQKSIEWQYWISEQETVAEKSTTPPPINKRRRRPVDGWMDGLLWVYARPFKSILFGLQHDFSYRGQLLVN